MSKIRKIQAVRDDKAGLYEKLYVKRGLRSFVVTDKNEIFKILEELRKQEGVELVSHLLGNKKFELISKYNPEKAKQGIYEINPYYEDVTNAWANAHRISNAKLNKTPKYSQAKEMPRKRNNFKRIVVGTVVGALAVSLAGCGITKLITKDKKNATKLTSEESNVDNDYQLTDREILEKDFDYYADNYVYTTQMKIAYTAQAFLEQANTNIKNANILTEDGKQLNGLFTADEALIYAITIHNLGVDELIDIYQDSKFDFGKLEDDTQSFITKFDIYQLLVSQGRVEQLDFTAEFMTSHDEFVEEVFVTLATDIKNIGDAEKAQNVEKIKEYTKKLHDDLKEYSSSGNLSQSVKDTILMYYSAGTFVGTTTEQFTGSKYFTEEFYDDLVSLGLCNDKEKLENEVMSDHDVAMADKAANSEVAQKIHNEQYNESINNKAGYVYYIEKALQELANSAERSNKHNYLEVTDANIKKVHETAETLIRDYLVEEKGLAEDSNEFKEEFNNIVTDNQDGRLTMETVRYILKSSAKEKGLDISELGISPEDTQNIVLKSMYLEISKGFLENSISIGGRGSTALPKPVQETLNISEEEAIRLAGQAAVDAAKEEINGAALRDAEKKAVEVEEAGQSYFDSGDYGKLTETAGSNNSSQKEKYEKEMETAIKDKEESDKITSQGPSGKENITQDYEKEEETVIVDQGIIPDGAHTGKIEWSNGESLGENADEETKQVIADPTNAIEESAPVPEVQPEPAPEAKPEPTPEPTPEPAPTPETNTGISGGDINYDIPEDMFEPVAVYSEETDSIDVTAFYAAVAEEMVEEMATNPTPEAETENVLTK